MQDHRKLKVWIRSHALALDVRRASHRFPRSDYGSLKSQVIDACESVPFNIAEGCGASSQKEFARYLGISIKSTSELEAELELAKDYQIPTAQTWEKLAQETVEVRKMLCGLRKKVLGEGDP